MLMKSVRRTLGAICLGLLATFGVSMNANAQMGGDGVLTNSITWPQHLTIGFGAAADLNFMSSGRFNTPEGPSFTRGPGFPNPEGHILLEIPIASNMMFAPRVQYSDRSILADNGQGGFFTGASIPNNTTGKTPDASRLALSYSTIDADLLFKYSFNNFHIMVGPMFSTPIANSYAFSDRIEDATQANHPIPNPSSFLAFADGGLGYDIPINAKKTIWLTPEAFFSYPLTNFTSDKVADELYITTVRGGASLKFNLGGEEAAPAPMAALGASITARGVLPDGSISAEPVVPQQGLHSRTSMPLLPYVFFDMGKSDIPARYSRSGSTGFTTQSLAGKEAIDANHSVLDIVGMRLKGSNAPLTIVGTNSNNGTEKANINLSKARAMAVRDYLVNTWGIDASRITVDQRNLPEIPTNPVTAAGQEENRRAEISSTDATVTAPVRIESTGNVAVGATTVRFETSVSPADHAWSNWSIALDQNGNQVGTTLSGSGAPPAVQTMDIPGAQGLIGQPLHYKLTATDASGRTATADGMTTVTNRTVDRENLERYAMLSFDFDRSEINARARQMLDLIGESISRNATGVNIDGFCDNTGTDEYNQALSEARANSAVTALRDMTPLPANTTVRGHGERDPKFDNALPEGRQLNRRVEFTIEKSSQ